MAAALRSTACVLSSKNAGGWFCGETCSWSKIFVRWRMRARRKGCILDDGEYARSGNIIYLQQSLRFHPGLNVGLGTHKTLFAMEDGRVIISCEIIQPNWNHHAVEKTYGHRKGQNIYKKYFHVIPTPLEKKFNLISQI